MNIREYLENHKLLTDGAMGTYFDSIEKENYICSEEANITNPALVREIHRSYVKNGAQLLRSNTFLANEGTFLSLTQAKAEAFENITLKQLIIAGYQLAKETAQEVYQEEYPIFAAADIGPILEERDSEEADILQQYYEICDSFLEAGADIFVLETFPDTQYVLKMAEYIRKSCPEAFIIGQFSLTPTGYSRTGFHYKTILQEATQSGLLDGAGLNCGVGAAHMKKFLKSYIEEFGVPEDMVLTSLPNCGYPQIVRGHAVYSDSVPYFGEKLGEISELGVQVLGGCCGTTPEYIGEIYKTVFQVKKTEGAVKIDGVDVREMTQKDVRERLGYVPQKGILFSGTIDSNIRYGKTDISEEEVKEAAQVAQAEEFIVTKPEGYESPIAQGGSNVSGGQKQRLSIARAIAKKPEIFIFDDSFSALDFKTDSTLRKALKEHTKDTTTIIVAQRISTILNADKIIVLDDGRMAGIGTHKELMKNCEVYRQIAMSQLSEEELA